MKAKTSTQSAENGSFQAVRIELSPEQEAVLGTALHFIESAIIYFRAVLHVVCEEDELVLKGLLELGEICKKNSPRYFPELEPLAEEWKKLGARDADNWAKARGYRFGHKDTPHLAE